MVCLVCPASPLTAPVVLRALLSLVFVYGFVCEQSDQTVQFLGENQLIAPDLLRYTTLDEIAFISFKYGNATPVHLQVHLTVLIDAIFSCFLQVTDNSITISEGMKESSSELKACNCNSELEALRGKTDQMGIAFVCSVSRSLLQVELGLTCTLSAPGPISMVSRLESTASQFAWVVLEDQALQARMVDARIKRTGGDEVVVVQSVLQVSTFTETLVNSALYSIAAHHKPTICFMDENVMTLDNHGQPVATTGTQLRRLLPIAVGL